LSSTQLFAQERNEVIQQRIEFISEQLESEEIDLTDVFERLNYYFDNPLNLNTAAFDELRDLSLLSEVQINDLLLHRKLFGKLISKYELQSLKYWDLQTIELVLPFIRVDDKLDTLREDLKDCENTLAGFEAGLVQRSELKGILAEFVAAARK
jgi:hypothetical protein